MNFLKIVILFGSFLCTQLAVADEKSDSIISKELEEVVVLGDRAWIENSVLNVIPTKQEKKLSNSPATLIESMHLPFVKVKDGSVTSMSGEQIVYFINGKKIDEIDLGTFWPKDVTLVQYMENPGDPAYGGAKYVINFKMHEYEAGGVTRVNLTQRIPNWGIYSAASKLVYKKMSYGAMFTGSYDRDHRASMTGETQYNDIYYDNKFYEEILRKEENSSYNRKDNLNFAVNAKYSTNNSTITHTFSLGWNRNPGSGSHGSNVWSENLFGSGTSSYYSTFRSITPQLRGEYFFRFSNKWALYSTTTYLHAHNNSYSQSILGHSQPVDNTVIEDVNTLKIFIQPTFSLSDKLVFQFKASGSANWFSSLYEGSVNTHQNQTRQDVSSVVRAWWNPHISLTLNLEAGVSASLWKIGEVNEKSVSPVVDFSIYWNPTRKFMLACYSKFLLYSPTASESNPVMMKCSDLLWTIGNPYLKGGKAYNINLQSSFIPIPELTLVYGGHFSKYYDYTYNTYRAAQKEYGGIIQETLNARPYDEYYAFIGLESSLFDSNFNLGIDTGYRYIHARDGIVRNADNLGFSGRADYTLGNFRFNLSYNYWGKTYNPVTMIKDWSQDEWNFSVTYGTGNIYVRFSIDNIFHNKHKNWEKYQSPNYSSYITEFRTGRQFAINLTYTFGYGKKVDKGINISGPSDVSSSIRNMD